MSDELKPCERCTRKAELRSQTYDDGTTDYWVQCQGQGIYCNEESGTFDTPEKAIKNWNDREIDDLRIKAEMLTARIDRFKNAINHAIDELDGFKNSWSSVDPVIKALQTVLEEDDE